MIRPKSTMERRGVEIDLTGPDGNAFALMGYAKYWAKQMGLDYTEILAEMTAGDYENLLAVLEKYFGNLVTFYR